MVIAAAQTSASRGDLEKCYKTNPCLGNSALIRPRLDLPKSERTRTPVVPLSPWSLGPGNTASDTTTISSLLACRFLPRIVSSIYRAGATSSHFLSWPPSPHSTLPTHTPAYKRAMRTFSSSKEMPLTSRFLRSLKPLAKVSKTFVPIFQYFVRAEVKIDRLILSVAAERDDY